MGLLRIPGYVRRYLSIVVLSALVIFTIHKNIANRQAVQPYTGSIRSRIVPRPHPQTRVRAPADEVSPPPTKVRVEKHVVDRVAQVHEYRNNGLLEVNPSAPHPIPELIARAEASWKSKLGKASKTLEEAVVEYKRRYKRAPPRGFDKWWEYVRENNVQLPDEYDQIHRDLESFWGARPSDLEESRLEWQSHRDSYTIRKGSGWIDIQNHNFSPDYSEDERDRLLADAYDILELLSDVEQHIPPFSAVFSPHDNANHLEDHELITAALRAAKTGNLLDPKQQPDPKLLGWISACHTSSKAFSSHSDDELEDEPIYESVSSGYTKSFIHDHRATMDPCQHPSLLQTHGQFLSWETGPVPPRHLIPAFSYSPTTLHSDIMIPTLRAWVEDANISRVDLPWEDKHDKRLHWRGSNTGIWHAEGKRWRESQRDRLVQWANSDMNHNITVLLPFPGAEEDEDDEIDPLAGAQAHLSQSGHIAHIPKSVSFPEMMDVAFAAQPVQCAPKTCKELQRDYKFGKYMTQKDVAKYKYVLDVDGNGWSSRFKRVITSNALVFKSTIYPEWWTDRIAPWVHYVPVQVDYSDLMDSFIFFRGDVKGRGGHDDLARKIATAGREWSKTFWRKEDLTAYLFRLFLEYARVMSPDRDTMSYEAPKTTLP
ncbi:hypothetical protein HGRIS_014535 [Hohenbuehelia grisea]|uniref:Glycosyl transferase CAP10 domain-containing protein n=1 Tax=Hohenbuehelia grisea TaxID=104357 RepID=A0ABR3JTU6_9AGAR